MQSSHLSKNEYPGGVASGRKEREDGVEMLSQFECHRYEILLSLY